MQAIQETGTGYKIKYAIEVPADSPASFSLDGKGSSNTLVKGEAGCPQTSDFFQYIPEGAAIRRFRLENGNDQIVVAAMEGFSGEIKINALGNEQTINVPAEAIPTPEPKLPQRERPPEIKSLVDKPHSPPSIDPGSSSEPTRTEASANIRTDHSFKLVDYILPSPDQAGAGSCLYMTATGIAEVLLNKSLGIKKPQLGGPTDLSEQWTIGLSRQHALLNNYTDAVDLLARGGAVPDSHLKFKAYSQSSWILEPPPALAETTPRYTMPPVEKVVLFNAGGEGTQRSNGVMGQKAIEEIKTFLKENESPVLFTYQPPGVNYWHANMVIGYDDTRQVFITRDSAFGTKQNEIYQYGNQSPWGNIPYRGEYEMSYQQVMAWGNHATGYRLANKARDEELASK
jgi:hypothetical protein